MKYDSTNCCYLTRWLLDPITLKAWTTSQHKGSFTSRISCNTSPAPAANEALSSLFKCKPPVIWAKGETPSWGAARNQLPGYTTTKPSPRKSRWKSISFLQLVIISRTPVSLRNTPSRCYISVTHFHSCLVSFDRHCDRVQRGDAPNNISTVA